MRSTRWLVTLAAAGVVLGGTQAASAQVEVKVKEKVKVEAPKVKVEERVRVEEPRERERVVVEEKRGEGEERLAVSYPERGIVIGDFILAPSMVFQGGQIDLGIAKDGYAGLSFGARFGITRDFEVHAYPLPFVFAPKAAAGYGGLGPLAEGLGGPSFGAIYRFLRGPIEVGGGLDVTIFTNDITGVQIAPSVPVRVHVGKIAALDAALVVPINAGLKAGAGGSNTAVGLEVPVAFSIDVIEPVLHVGINSGFGFEHLNTVAGESAGQSFFIPLGFFGGYAIPGKKGPLLDIDPFFRWPDLFTPGVPAPLDKVNAGNIQVGLEVAGFLYL
jgi:hypothetical protein